MLDVVASKLATTTVYLGGGSNFWNNTATRLKEFFYDGMAVLGGKGLGWAILGLAIFLGLLGIGQRHFMPNARVQLPSIWVSIILGGLGALLAFTGVDWLVNFLKSVGEWLKELAPS